MEVAEARFRVMGSEAHVMVIDAPDEALGFATRRLETLEGLWSRFREESDVTRLNLSAGHPVRVAAETLTLVEVAITAWRMTAGAFDPTVLGKLVAAGYVASRFDPEALTGHADSLGTETNCGGIEVDRDTGEVTLPTGVGFDPGGIGKGLAADLVVLDLLESGAAGAMVSVGGDLRVEGHGPEGSWRVVAEDPFYQDRVIAVVRLAAGGVATSSRTSRLLPDGSPHLIDPLDGPVDDAVAATVIAGSGWMAEAFAKAALLAGVVEGPRVIDDAGMAGLVVSRQGSLALSARMGAYL